MIPTKRKVPARSTKDNFPVIGVPSFTIVVTYTIKIEWDLELTSLIWVEEVALQVDQKRTQEDDLTDSSNHEQKPP
jgi:hypothetical protein